MKRGKRVSRVDTRGQSERDGVVNLWVRRLTDITKGVRKGREGSLALDPAHFREDEESAKEK